MVGSISDKKEDGWISEPYNLSPFSRRGPGPAYIIKPDIVHLGGNAGVNSQGEIIQGGVKSFSKMERLQNKQALAFPPLE